MKLVIKKLLAKSIIFKQKLKNFNMAREWLKWNFGRQKTGYKKMLLATSKFLIPFDLYILKFEEGNSIPEHTDPVKSGFKHYRLNIILKKSTSGGEFIAEKSIINWPRLKFFRPDLFKHSVTTVVGKPRYVLSFGLLIKEKN